MDARETEKIIRKTAFDIFHICIYIYIYIYIYLFIYLYIFFSFTPAYDIVPRTETATDPQKSHLMFPRNAILMWYRQLPSHVVPTTDICMWSPPLTSHVVPRTDLNQFQVPTVTVDKGNGPSVVLPAESYGLLELAPVSRKFFPFPPFPSGNNKYLSIGKIDPV
jgi:hypothetical protein